MAEPAVQLRGVSKDFGGTRALEDIDLAVELGHVHGLVGQNGAGKSTLGKILSGVYERDSGDFIAFGTAVRRWSPRAALAHGIAMIQQELSLVPGLTVAQNVYLGIEEQRFGMLSRRESARFEQLNARAGFQIKPSAQVGALRFADRQKVEILRALARNAKLIIMDEPTSALSANETEQLHDIIRRLADDGHAVVYVSHFLGEVLHICDRVTSMRNGRVVRTGPASGETEESLVTAMLGRSFEIAFPDKPKAPPASEPLLLSVRGLRSDPTVSDVSFEVRPGEIIGLAGLVGSGRSETLRAIFGADASNAGSVEIEGRPYEPRSPLRSLDLGLGMIPEDRRIQGLIATLRVGENISLPNIRRLNHWGLIRRRQEAQTVAGLLRDLEVVPERGDADVMTLSGGNQQKVLFGKWLTVSPRLLLLDEPTRGIDVGAKRQIYNMIVSLAAQGLGVVLVSSELEEVMGLSHRVYLISGGRTIGAVDPSQTTLDQILFRLFGLDASEHRS